MGATTTIPDSSYATVAPVASTSRVSPVVRPPSRGPTTTLPATLPTTLPITALPITALSPLVSNRYSGASSPLNKSVCRIETIEHEHQLRQRRLSSLSSGLQSTIGRRPPSPFANSLRQSVVGVPATNIPTAIVPAAVPAPFPKPLLLTPKGRQMALPVHSSPTPPHPSTVFTSCGRSPARSRSSSLRG
eukprot:Filipodium_phascolosomae@DN8113_c0_g1_i1.p1